MTEKITIRPLEDRIVVQPLEAETTTASGLVLPDSAQEKPAEAVVLAVGPGRYENGTLVPMSVAVGDHVLHARYGGTEIKHQGQEYVIFPAREILAIIEK
jgi:chaperonin GroES